MFPALVPGLAFFVFFSPAIYLCSEDMVPGKWIGGELAAGEALEFQLAVPAESQAHLLIEQLGIDLHVSASLSDGTGRFTADQPIGRWGPEWLVIETGHAANYRITLRAKEGEGRGAFKAKLLYVPGPQAAEPEPLARRAYATAGKLLTQRPKLRDEALIHYRQALELWQQLGDRPMTATLHLCLAATLGVRRHPTQVQEHANQALILFRELKNRFQQGKSLNFLGLAALTGGRPSAARTLFQEAHDCFDADVRWRAAIDQNLAAVCEQLGEPQQAERFYQKALKEQQALSDHLRAARTLTNLARLQRRGGDLSGAMKHYNQALQLFRDRGDEHWQAVVANNIGFAVLKLGDPQKAEPWLQEALTLRRKVGDRIGEMATLVNLALLQEQTGKPVAALLPATAALVIAQEIGHTGWQSNALSILARCHLKLGRLQEAQATAEKALAFVNRNGDRLGQLPTLVLRGEVAVAAGQPARALESLNKAIDLSRTFKDPLTEAEALFHRAGAERLRGEQLRAVADLRHALDLMDRVRARIPNQVWRARQTATQRRVTERLIESLLDLHRSHRLGGYDIQAFQVSELAHARVLVESLNGFEASVDEQVVSGIAEKRNSLGQRLEAKLALLRSRVGGRLEAGERAAMERQVDLLLSELEILENSALANPDYAALVRPKSPSLAELQSRLGEDGLLLAYFIGQERSFLWALSQAGLAYHELAASAHIRSLAVAARARLATRTYGASGLADDPRVALAEALLGPVKNRLSCGVLVVVPDGVLGYIPFGALPVPGRDADDPLLLKRRVTVLPSAGLLAAPATRVGLKTRNVAVLADPVYGSDDPRLGKRTTLPSGSSPPSGERPPTLVRLPGTGLEARAIAAVAPDAQLLQGFQATRSWLTEGPASEFQVIHLAAHGVFDLRYPSLSGIALSHFDTQGKPIQGMLRLADTYRLKLSAELVVLSGCETALGESVAGEGLLGLSRGFLYAGGRTVISSLWRVDDRASAALFGHFYRYFLQAGLQPAEALRRAQMDIRGTPLWRQPVYWAGFVITGPLTQ